MRFVHYYRSFTSPSGVTAAIHTWVRASQDAGIDVTVLHNAKVETGESNSAGIRHIGAGRQFQVPFWLPLKKGDVLILHEGWVSSNYIAALIAIAKRIPYIVMPHGVYEPGVQSGLKFRGIRLLLERWYLSRAEKVHVFFEGETHNVLNVSPTAKCIIMIMPFINNDLTSVPRAREGKYIAWFGRYDVLHKGLDRLLMAYRLIPEESRFPLFLRGTDYHNGKAHLMRLINTLALEGWVYVGPELAQSEKVDFLTNARAFVFPSRWESYGISLVEALASGTQVIASNEIQFASLLELHDAASVVSFEDPFEASKALTQLTRGGSAQGNGRAFVMEHLGLSIATSELQRHMGLLGASHEASE